MAQDAGDDPTDVNAILLLGAGASYPFGYPVTEGLLKKIKKNDEEGLELSPEEFWDFVDASTLDEMIRELLDVVNLTSGVAPRNFLRDTVGALHLPGEEDNLMDAWDDFQDHCETLLDVILKEIYDTYSWHENITPNLGALEFYVEKVAELNGGHAPVFTTNYDTIVESLAPGDYDIHTLFADDPSSGTAIKNNKKVRNWCGRSALAVGEKTVNCIKLHGSVDWQRVQNRLVSVGTFDETIDAPSRDKAEIIPPGAQIGTERVAEPYITYFNLFKEHLDSCDLCIVIGHTLEDDEILETLQTHDPDLIVVDPKQPSREKLDEFTTYLPVDKGMQTSAAQDKVEGYLRDLYQSGPPA